MLRFIFVLCTLLLTFPGTASAEVRPVRTVSVFLHDFPDRQMPADIVVSPDGRHSVFEAVEGKLHRFAGGVPVSAAPLDGGVGGMCFVRSGAAYYLCSPETGSVIVLDRFLRHPKRITRPPSLTGKPFDPTDFAPDGAGTAVVTDNDNHRIFRIDLETGELMGAVGRFGFGNREFRFPFALAVAKNGDVYVSDVLNTRIVKLTAGFKSVNLLGGWGIEPGQFFRPKGIALFNDRFILAADGTMGLIQVFAVDGTFIGVISDAEGNFRRWRNPVRIRVSGNLLGVIDFLDGIVEVLRIDEVLP